MSTIHQISGCESRDRRADVLFLHGLGGNAFETWRHGSDESTSWPHWLGDEFPDVGVWSLDYAAAAPGLIGRLLRLTKDGGSSADLRGQAVWISEQMKFAGFGKRPLMLIGHSLGGLLAKKILHCCHESIVAGTKPIFESTMVMLFLATPHRGTPLASIAHKFKKVIGTTPSVVLLRAKDTELTELYFWYRKNAAGIQTSTYCELVPLLGKMLIVDQISSDSGVGEPILLREDHLSIAKPRSTDSHVYQSSVDLLSGVLRSSAPDWEINFTLTGSRAEFDDARQAVFRKAIAELGAIAQVHVTYIRAGSVKLGIAVSETQGRRLMRAFDRREMEEYGVEEARLLDPHRDTADYRKQTSASPAVLLSYAHEDESEKEKLLLHLRGIENLGEIQLWPDNRIGEGSYQEIEAALGAARVAIVLVSKRYLASRFCQEEDFRYLAQRQRKGKLVILPLLIDQCLFDQYPWLMEKEMLSRDEVPLSEHENADKARLDLARAVSGAVRHPVPDAFIAPQIFDHYALEHYDLKRLPETGSSLVGRRDELNLLNEAWDNGETNVIVFTAAGGVGKSTLTRVWTERLAEEDWRGADRAFAWSFYSQGKGKMTDAEAFIDAALRWFDDKTPDRLSLWGRGRRLAKCVQERRTLLILDGIEPLQSDDEGVDRNSIRDPGLRTLLEELAKGNPGLCVVTTREPLADLGRFSEPSVLHRDLDQISGLEGRVVFRAAGVQGSDRDIETAVDDLGGHALAVSLLSALLADGDTEANISDAKQLPGLRPEGASGYPPDRVLDAWEERLGDSADLELLHLIGLFDRPAERGAVQAVIQGTPLPGLTEHLHDADLGDVLKRLRRARLIARQSTHEDTIDAHPVVREHFGERLRVRHDDSWLQGNHRLYHYYLAQPTDDESKLRNLEPLFQAVSYARKAGRFVEALDDVFFGRINANNNPSRRADEYRPRYAEHRLRDDLGGLSTDCALLYPFFDRSWHLTEAITRPSQGTEADALSSVGIDLRMLGNLEAAVPPLERALELAGHCGPGGEADDDRLTNYGRHLCQLYLTRGDVNAAVGEGERAAEAGMRGGSPSQHLQAIVAYADALHQHGSPNEARQQFVDAEEIDTKPFLDKHQGYRYCDLLLVEGRFDEVIERCEYNRSRAKVDLHRGLADLGWARGLLRTRDLAGAEAKLSEALDFLHEAGQHEFLARAFLIRADLRAESGEFRDARADLDDALALAAGMRLLEADAYLALTRLELAAGNEAQAKATLTKAATHIQVSHYRRRVPELEALQASLAHSQADGLKLRELGLDLRVSGSRRWVRVAGRVSGDYEKYQLKNTPDTIDVGATVIVGAPFPDRFRNALAQLVDTVRPIFASHRAAFHPYGDEHTHATVSPIVRTNFDPDRYLDDRLAVTAAQEGEIARADIDADAIESAITNTRPFLIDAVPWDLRVGRRGEILLWCTTSEIEGDSELRRLRERLALVAGEHVRDTGSKVHIALGTISEFHLLTLAEKRILTSNLEVCLAPIPVLDAVRIEEAKLVHYLHRSLSRVSRSTTVPFART